MKRFVVVALLGWSVAAVPTQAQQPPRLWLNRQQVGRVSHVAFTASEGTRNPSDSSQIRFGWRWTEPSATPARRYPSTGTLQLTWPSGDNPGRWVGDSVPIALGVGPGRELWLLEDSPRERQTQAWRRFLDDVEAVYRQRLPQGERNEQRRIGTLNGCLVQSIPVDSTGGRGSWRAEPSSFEVVSVRAREPGFVAPPLSTGAAGAASGSDASVPPQVPQFLRWVEGPDLSRCLGEQVKLQLFPAVGDSAWFVEITVRSARAAAFPGVAPLAESGPGYRLLQPTAERLEGKLTGEGLSDGAAAGDSIDLCKYGLETLCAIDRRLRDQLYTVLNPVRLPDAHREALAASCRAALPPERTEVPNACGDTTYWRGRFGALYRTGYRGPLVISTNPRITSVDSGGVPAWRMARADLLALRAGGHTVTLPGGVLATVGLPVTPSAWYVKALRWVADHPWRSLALAALLLFVAAWVLWLVNGRRAGKPHPLRWMRDRGAGVRARLRRTGGGEQGAPATTTGADTAPGPGEEAPSGSGPEQPGPADPGTAAIEEIRERLGRIEVLIGALLGSVLDARALEPVPPPDSGPVAPPPPVITAEEIQREVRTAIERELGPVIADKKTELGTAAGTEKELIARAGEELREQLANERETYVRGLAATAKTLFLRPEALREKVSESVDEHLRERLARWAPREFSLPPETWDQLSRLVSVASAAPAVPGQLLSVIDRIPFRELLLGLERGTAEEEALKAGEAAAIKLYEAFRAELDTLEEATRSRLESTFAAGERLSHWIHFLHQSLAGTAAVVQDLPPPARNEWNEAVAATIEFSGIPARVFARILEQMPGRHRRVIGPIRPEEGEFLRRAGLVDGQELLPQRIRKYVEPAPEIGALGRVVRALQYLVEAFPREQMTQVQEEELRQALDAKLRLAGLPGSFHDLAEQMAAGVELEYRRIPYYDSQVNTTEFAFIRDQVSVISLPDRLGKQRASAPSMVIVRLERPFFFSRTSQKPIYYAGHAHVAQI